MSAPDQITDDATLAVLAELVAQRVVALLNAEPAPSAGFVDAKTVAAAIGMSVDYVREHADELGVRRVGSGPRPRLRFDLGEVVEAWAACEAGKRSQGPGSPVESGVSARRRRRSMGTEVGLLPVGPKNQARKAA